MMGLLDPEYGPVEPILTPTAPRGVLDAQVPVSFSDMMGRYMTGMDQAMQRMGGATANYLSDVVTGRKAAEGLRDFQDVSTRAMMGDPEAATDLGMRFLGVTAFHGSPHRFTKFSTKNIGTGEGAQAYGHGLYFAENPGVAREYAEKVRNVQINRELGDLYNAGKNRTKQYKSLVEERMNLPKGNLYKVDIADDAVKNFLDWDKPLSQQPESVRKAIDSMPDVKAILDHWGETYTSGPLTGRHLYEAVSMRSGGQFADQLTASNQLSNAGIKGIRYLDQGSRTAGKGTSNFVVFDEDIVKILSRE